MESVTIRDIARMCGVGVSTVSRAMNNHPDINPETKEKILQTIEQYGYIPNNSARNLKRSEARAIAVLVKGISNPFFSKMIKVFEQETNEERYDLVLQHVEERQDEIDIAIQLEKEKRLRGIIFLGGNFSHSEEKLKKISVPFVLSTVGLKNDPGEKYTSVGINDISESKKVMEYLISCGHRKIAFIGSREDDESIGYLRLQGYKEALQEHGIETDPQLIRYMTRSNENYSMESGYEMTKQLLESGTEFTAIFAIADNLAVGACKAILDSGKTVPGDYSVAGFDGLEIAQYYNPSITTLRQPAEEIAQATMDVLFGLIRKKSRRPKSTFEGTLVEGQSVRVLE